MLAFFALRFSYLTLLVKKSTKASRVCASATGRFEFPLVPVYI